jgi:PHD/YefM family antitoxin component YafN of YafNO toxin-antitoxin module
MPEKRDIYSVTEFQKELRKHLQRLKRTGKPAVLTQNGHAEAVIQSAKGYQELLAKADLGDSVRVLARRLEEDPKQDIPAEKVLREIRKTLQSATKLHSGTRR